MSAVAQLDIFEALREREISMQRVELASDSTYRQRLDEAIARLAARGTSFCADQVRELAGEPPAGCSHNIIGVAVNTALKRGHVDAIGFTRSARVEGHGNRLLLLRGRRS